MNATIETTTGKGTETVVEFCIPGGQTISIELIGGLYRAFRNRQDGTNVEIDSSSDFMTVLKTVENRVNHYVLESEDC